MHNAHDPIPLPRRATVTVEVSRGAFIKRDAMGRIDLVSPVPSLFNYGRVQGHIGGDGEPQDAIVLGPRLPRGHQTDLPVRGVLRFRDGTASDDKWVCGEHTPTRTEHLALSAFFSVYAGLKRVRDRLARQPPQSQFLGWQPASHT